MVVHLGDEGLVLGLHEHAAHDAGTLSIGLKLDAPRAQLRRRHDIRGQVRLLRPSRVGGSLENRLAYAVKLGHRAHAR